MIKKIFGVGATLFIIIFAIFLLWFSVFDGIDVIEEKTSVPEALKTLLRCFLHTED